VETFEVSEFHPDHRLAIRGTFGPFFGESSYDLQSAGDSTVLINQMRLDPSGGLAVLASLAAARVRTAVAANLSALKELLELGNVPRPTSTGMSPA
jgi:hypothetical protein